jgi:DNA polymerase III alpha subunit
MTGGGEVVEDYGHVGLTLRAPRRLPAGDLAARTHRDLRRGDGSARRKMAEAAGLVLVRQKPGSAKGVMFITIEDETGIANLVIWPSALREPAPHHPRRRHDGVRGRIQREGDVVHLVATN